MFEKLTLQVLDSIAEIPEQVWDRLMAATNHPCQPVLDCEPQPLINTKPTNDSSTTYDIKFTPSLARKAPDLYRSGEGINPFNRHAFLLALEQSGCVSAETGWKPMHMVLKSAQTVIAVMPLFMKSHSYGEYVFDWAWADAYQRHGLEYYPKLVTSIPFTPVSGNRIGVNAEVTAKQQQALYQLFQQQIIDWASQFNLSSWHCLFLPEQQLNKLDRAQGAIRMGVQFHWHNRGYRHFDDLLATMASRKRKNIRKERQPFLAESSTLQFTFVEGQQVSAMHIEEFHRCYQQTYGKRSGHKGYLNLAFFEQIAKSMPEQLLLLRVTQVDDPKQLVASALFFKTASHLYGRYWGALTEVDGLHFESCYYRGIDYCIAHGLTFFDAGAQGEHKLARGFEPVKTFSYHYIMDPQFSPSIQRFTQQERQDMAVYIQQARQALPYKQGE